MEKDSDESKQEAPVGTGIPTREAVPRGLGEVAQTQTKRRLPNILPETEAVSGRECLAHLRRASEAHVLEGALLEGALSADKSADDLRTLDRIDFPEQGVAVGSSQIAVRDCRLHPPDDGGAFDVAPEEGVPFNRSVISDKVGQLDHTVFVKHGQISFRLLLGGADEAHG